MSAKHYSDSWSMALRTSLIFWDKHRCTKRIADTASLVALVVAVKLESSGKTYLVIGHERRKKNGNMTTTKREHDYDKTGTWLRQNGNMTTTKREHDYDKTEQIRYHMWNRHSITVNKVMMAVRRLLKWWPQLYPYIILCAWQFLWNKHIFE
jgi:hypothetical protein